EEVYDAGGWTTLKRMAGQLPGTAPAGEDRLNKRFRFITHMDEAERLALYRDTVRSMAAPADPMAQRRLLMLGYLLYHKQTDAFPPSLLLERVKDFPALQAELLELFDLLLERCPPSRPSLIREDWPLALHRRYLRREIQTAVGHWSDSKKPRSSEGILRLVDQKAEILLVTLDKSEERFSPTTRYKDYAISRELFHWQSQSQTHEKTEAGRRYIEQASNGWNFYLFVRPTRGDPYVALGPVRYESHTAGRPISIVWRLDHPMPPALFESFATLLVA
ncbi:MAG: DUF3427 domain-containing protein, partial [Planctomycetota bacterium]